MFKIERMTEEANKKKRAVESEIMDTTTLQVNYFLFFWYHFKLTLSLQVELDKTASNFRRSHLDRQELIKRWEEIIEQM